jgi:hypothetical protein
MIRFKDSYKPSMVMALLFAAWLASGGMGRVFAAAASGGTVAPGVTVAPGSLKASPQKPS